MRINLRTLDLNLLRVMLALAESRSVSKASTILGMSQPATSNALSRLRKATGDPLFTRTREGMVPTAYADAMLPELRAHFEGLLRALGGSEGFDPANSERVFRLSLSGLGELVFLPLLLQEIWKEAPGIRVANRPTAAPLLSQALELGRIDCAIGIIGGTARGLISDDLFSDTYVMVGGRGLVCDPTSLQDLGDIKLIISTPEASYASEVEELLRLNGLSDRIHLRLAHFGAITQLLETLPVATILPERLALDYARAGKARVLPVRIEQPHPMVRLVWHERSDRDADLTWLRGHIVRLFARGPQLFGDGRNPHHPSVSE
ncbi:MAG: LysR family transcriptional regulator [Paracoccaceae bacterium]